ncbi:MAG: hypothetical protein WKG00_14420 [Polyangiaceae bacterium]
MPPSKVLVDGKAAGNAPVTGISLPPGTTRSPSCTPSSARRWSPSR